MDKSILIYFNTDTDNGDIIKEIENNYRPYMRHIEFLKDNNITDAISNITDNTKVFITYEISSNIDKLFTSTDTQCIVFYYDKVYNNHSHLEYKKINTMYTRNGIHIVQKSDSIDKNNFLIILLKDIISDLNLLSYDNSYKRYDVYDNDNNLIMSTNSINDINIANDSYKGITIVDKIEPDILTMIPINKDSNIIKPETIKPKVPIDILKAKFNIKG